MEMNKLLELKNGFASKTTDISLMGMLNILNSKNVTILEEPSVPMELTIFKFYKGLPIQVIVAQERRNKEMHYVIVKGSSEIENLRRWYEEKEQVFIQGIDGSYEKLNEQDKAFMLEQRCPFSRTIFEAMNDEVENPLSLQELVDIIKEYYAQGISITKDIYSNGASKGVIGRVLPSDNTLSNMKKSELIKLLHIAEHNYEALLWFYNNAVNVNMEKLKENK